MNDRERVRLACEAARAAGEMLLNYHDLHVDKKGQNDYVTDADRASEAMIRQALLSACPGDGFYGEEGGASGDAARGQWVVDPIDGTTNFIYGLHPYVISIAYMQNGRPTAGVVYAPVTGETFTATLDGGAYLNDRPIRASSAAEPGQCLLGMSFAHRNPPSARRMFELIPRLAGQVNDMRRLGSAAYDLCNVACGRYDAYIELNLKLYDIAAGALIVEEAGGRVSGWPGGGDCLITGDILACAPGLYDWLRDELAR